MFEKVKLKIESVIFPSSAPQNILHKSWPSFGACLNYIRAEFSQIQTKTQKGFGLLTVRTSSMCSPRLPRAVHQLATPLPRGQMCLPGVQTALGPMLILPVASVVVVTGCSSKLVVLKVRYGFTWAFMILCREITEVKTMFIILSCVFSLSFPQWA